MARRLKLVEALPADEMMTVLAREGWRNQPPTEAEITEGGFWHVRNPGDEEIYVCKPQVVVRVIKAGGICRRYVEPPQQFDPKHVASVVALSILGEIQGLDTFKGLVEAEKVIEIVKRHL